jgi:SAM-dependent methyltransferase
MMQWTTKIAAKIVLSRLPVPRKLFNKLGIFRHGLNAEAAYAYGVFAKHYNLAMPPAGFSCLELGPGDALASAVLTCAFGGLTSIQCDVAFFARADPKIYQAIAVYSAEKGYPPPSLESATSLADVLRICNARYLTSGLASMREISTASVDFLFSHAALEHVRAAEFIDLMREMRRILKPSGVASHQVDLRDHLAESLNNLRFPDAIWESPLMADSGFYTNRISCSEMVTSMENAGFAVKLLEKSQWDLPPLPRSALSRRFRERSEDDLRTRGFLALCRPI